MIEREVVVVGAGPAGLSAAIVAARAGADTLLVDENDRPGGQLFKQIHKFFGSSDHRAGVRGIDIGYQLLDEAHKTGVEVWLNSVVWGLFSDHKLGILRDGRSQEIQAQHIVLATGAMENALSFRGWTLPGVMTAGAAQTMINMHRVLPGRRALIVGAGNVGLIVAYQFLQAGGEIAAVVEALPTISGYGVHASKLRRVGVPILTSHTLLEASGAGQVQTVTIAQVDEEMQPLRGTERTLAADSVLLAVGLTPMAELAMLAGCEFTYIPSLGGHVPVHDEYMQSSVPRIYVSGDITGIEEASAAMEEGIVAGASIAAALGYLPPGEVRRQVDQAQERIIELRLGQFGEKRARAKEQQIRCAAGENIPPATDCEKMAPVGATGGLASTGIPSEEELRSSPGYPSPERLSQGRMVVIECVQDIPCNPCEDACPQGIICVGEPITNVPSVRRDGACTGCGLCVAACPGLAIFVVDMSYSEVEALVSFPYEFTPLPDRGDRVPATDREGVVVAEGQVVRIQKPSSFDRTAVVTIAVPHEYAMTVRGIAHPGDPGIV